MTYIVPKGYQGICLSGHLSIHENSLCESRNGIIYWCGTPVCFDTSEDAHQFFACNDDGMGKLRYEYTQKIQAELKKKKDHQKRWDKIWAAPGCQKFKRPEHPDHWLWNHDFFNAKISELRYIAELIGVTAQEVENVRENECPCD